MKSGPSELSRPLRSTAARQLLAVIIFALPYYSSSILLHLWREQPLSTQQFMHYLAVIAPLSIVVALLLLRFLCGEKLKDLNLRPGKLTSDLLATLVLSVVIVVANVISHEVLSGLLADSADNTGVRNLFAEMTGDPRLMVLFLGLLIPLGAASEEVVRVFLLSRLWKVWPSVTAKLVVVVISACLFGLSHAFQGPTGIAWTTICGLIMALYYLRFGRVVPLLLAHYVTNTLYVVIFAVSAR